ncbi:MAG: PPOX class F420-dependent oxidoreductase [Nitrososphaerota archaeon]
MPLTDRLRKAKFISLETYKRSGEAVRTPVWFAEKDGLIYFHTPAKSGKVKRLRRNPVVRLAPCSRFGRIEGEWIKGRATRIDGEDAKRIVELVNSRLGLLDRIIGLFHRKNRVAFSIKLDDC